LSITKKGKAWEYFNSLWIIWTFLIPFGFVAFFKIGSKAKYKIWTLFGYIYLFLGVSCLFLTSIAKRFESTLFGTLLSLFIVFSWITPIIHAFLVKKAYLVRREFVLENNISILSNEEFREKIRKKAYSELQSNNYKPGKSFGFNKSRIQILNSASNVFISCQTDIAVYLRENESTSYFREKLSAVAERLNALVFRYDNLKGIITKRFGSAGLTYNKFVTPVTVLQYYTINLVNSLMMKMRTFNEEEYSRRINEFTQSNRVKEAEGYKSVEHEYKNYTEKTLAALDDAVLKLDKLTLEISKLGESDSDKALHIMQDLEATIKDTQLYKYNN